MRPASYIARDRDASDAIGRAKLPHLRGTSTIRWPRARTWPPSGRTRLSNVRCLLSMKAACDPELWHSRNVTVVIDSGSSRLMSPSTESELNMAVEDRLVGQ